MSYTVKKLSKLSGVSVRTLHWYDKIGLLKPAYYGSNGYRYYGEAQLFKLQQILFFRELGFQLDAIHKILAHGDFNHMQSLSEHKDSLKKKINQFQQLVNIINCTLDHLKKDEIIQHKELYEGIGEWAEDRAKEAYYLWHYDGNENCDKDAEAIILNNLMHHHTKACAKDDLDNFAKQDDAIFKEIVSYLEQGMEPKSDLVQNAIKKHCDLSSKFHKMSREVYLALADLYSAKQEYRDKIKRYHPELVPYLVLAMRIYAYTNLE